MRFDDLLDGKWLRSLLEEGTGKGVRVGILDSGIESRLPELQGAVVASYDVAERRGRGPEVVPMKRGDDLTGHGTACAYIVHQQAPDAEIYDLRVVGEGMDSTSEKLIAALSFAGREGWDILNLSLGTDQNYERLSRLADAAFYAGAIWVAARDGKLDRANFPASFPSVVGVDMDYFEDPTRFRFFPDNPIEVEASGVYVEAPSPDGGTHRFTGSSFACPQVAGIAARLRGHFPSMSAFQFRTALAALCENPPPGGRPRA
ncbi:MAG: S8 family serine peptidase [Verrucomicrobiales bacterium]